MWVEFIDLLFCDKLVLLAVYLYVHIFPVVHFHTFSAWLNYFNVSCAVPYSCLLFSVCVAYAETGLLVLMYRICSLVLNVEVSVF